MITQDISNLNIIELDSDECPICLEFFGDSNEFIIVECCNKKLHINCLVNWYTMRPDNKYCFMCNQNNIFCKDFVYNTNLEIDNSNTIITMNSTNNPYAINNQYVINDQLIISCMKIFAIILCIIIIFIGISYYICIF